MLCFRSDGLRVIGSLFCAAIFFFGIDAGGASSLFIPRNISRNAIYELALSRYFAQHTMLDFNSDTYLCVATATPLYRKGLDPQRLSHLLLPSQKGPVTVAQNGSGQIWSGWLGLMCPEGEPFSSQFNITPVRTVYGAHLNAYLNLEHTLDGLWANVASFAGIARHELAFSEYNVNNAGCDSSRRSVASIFDTVEWGSGTIATEPVERSGLDDIFAKLGYAWYWGDENLFSLYAVGNIPTARDRKMTRLFDPVLGSPFWYAGGGAHLDIGTWLADELYVNLMIDGWYARGFEAAEHRLFDLHGRGQWSRYLQFVRNEQEPTLLPGATALFSRATIDPGALAQLLAAFHIEYYSWHLEVGYNFWHRGQEHITKLFADQDVGIAYLPDVQKGIARTASRATINAPLTSALADEVFHFISEHDLDKSSAVAGAALSHSLYGGLMYTTFIDNAPCGIGIGAQYETTKSPTVVPNWSVWTKLILGF